MWGHVCHVVSPVTGVQIDCLKCAIHLQRKQMLHGKTKDEVPFSCQPQSDVTVCISWGCNPKYFWDVSLFPQFCEQKGEIKEWRMKEKTEAKSICYFKQIERGSTYFGFSAILVAMCWLQMHHRYRNLRSIDPVNCYKQTQEGGQAWSEQVWSEVTKLNRHPEVHMFHVKELKLNRCQYKKKQFWIILPLSCSFWPRCFFVHKSSHKRKRKQTKAEKKTLAQLGS